MYVHVVIFAIDARMMFFDIKSMLMPIDASPLTIGEISGVYRYSHTMAATIPGIANGRK